MCPTFFLLQFCLFNIWRKIQTLFLFLCHFVSSWYKIVELNHGLANHERMCEFNEGAERAHETWIGPFDWTNFFNRRFWIKDRNNLRTEMKFNKQVSGWLNEIFFFFCSLFFLHSAVSFFFSNWPVLGQKWPLKSHFSGIRKNGVKNVKKWISSKRKLKAFVKNPPAWLP